MELSINLLKTNSEYVASCPELEVNCYGSDKGEAIQRIKNVLQFYIHSAEEMGIELESLEKVIIDGEPSQNIYTENYVNTISGLN